MRHFIDLNILNLCFYIFLSLKIYIPFQTNKIPTNFIIAKLSPYKNSPAAILSKVFDTKLITVVSVAPLTSSDLN